MVERHAVLRDGTRLRLSDVVQQRRQPHEPIALSIRFARRHVRHDGDRVLEHVLVTMNGILFETKAGNLGQELVEEPGVVQEPEPGRGVVDDEELVQLVADPLGRHDLHPVAQLLDRRLQRSVGLQAVCRDETRRSEHSQRIVGERLLRCEGRAQPVVHEKVGAPVERIDELGLGERQCHRVHGEVAARKIGLDRVGEFDSRLARVRVVGLGAVGRDLEGAVALPRPDRAEALALGPQCVGPSVQERLRLLGPSVGGEIDVRVLEGTVREQIADDATDEVQPVPGRGEPLGQWPRLLEDGPQPLLDHGLEGSGDAKRRPLLNMQTRDRLVAARCGGPPAASPPTARRADSPNHP